MKKLKAILLVLSLIAFINSQANHSLPLGGGPGRGALGRGALGRGDSSRAKEILNRMTLDEKLEFLGGKTSFSLFSYPHLGIPEVLLADGPQGIRNHHPHSTLYPSGILSASTWNRGLLERLGEGLGKDARSRGVSILLGPGVNIYRSPLCGRNYEYFGEDPYLAGETGKHYILGVQRQGVIATVKHFAANNQEWNRHHAGSEVDERTLHEIYFPAFRKAVQEAHVGAVMNSYNPLNGVHATENRWLNTDILRGQWGFKGILMSDWTSVYSTVNTANSGLDLEMPKKVFFKPELMKEALAQGRITEQTIDKKVMHLLQTLIDFGVFDREQADNSIPKDNPSSRATALDLAREGMVLLKNEGRFLPLQGRTVVMGPNANRITTGGGSGFVSPFSSVTVAEGMRTMNKKTVLLTDDVLYDNVLEHVMTPDNQAVRGFKAEYFDNKRLQGSPVMMRTDQDIHFDWAYGSPCAALPTDSFSVRWTGIYTPQEDQLVKVTVGGDDGYRVKIDGKTVAADWGNHAYTFRETEIRMEQGHAYRLTVEFYDNISTAKVDFSMEALNEKLLEREVKKADNVVVCLGFNSDIEGEGFDRPFALPEAQEQLVNKVAALNTNVAVVLNAGGGVDMRAWEPAAKAILMAWYPGQEGGTAVAEILTGKTNPSGKLPITMEMAWEDNPVYENYYANNSMRGENPRIDYREGIFVGYRGYEQRGIKPRYAFGYGLSYTSFEYSDMQATLRADGTVEVNCCLTNTGKREGAEVVQVYVSDPQCTVPRPKKELKGFEKVNLKPGESKRVSVVLTADAFMFYDIDQHAFRLEPGEFHIMMGAASDDIRLSKSIQIL